MLTRIIAICFITSLAACATPGYDYHARVAPNFPDAAAYTDVEVGRFDGPAGAVAEDAFIALIMETELNGQAWFGHTGAEQAQGRYEGVVDIAAYDEDTVFKRDRTCVERDGLFDCDRHDIIESECTRQTVEVRVTASLIDLADQTLVFTSQNGGEADREACLEIARFPDRGEDLNDVTDPRRASRDISDAPIGMIEDATRAAVAHFRYDIAPYMHTLRAEIMTEPLTNEIAYEPRFELAVKATKRGEFMGACAQWDVLLREYPNAPSILHNAASCAEARGDMATAQTRYAQAADIARTIPLLKDKKARPIFDALERISAQRRDNAMINRAIDTTDQPPNRPES